jgi:hypothetical protein
VVSDLIFLNKRSDFDGAEEGGAYVPESTHTSEVSSLSTNDLDDDKF